MSKTSAGTIVGSFLGHVILISVMVALFWCAFTSQVHYLSLLCWILGPIEVVIFIGASVRAGLHASQGSK